MSLSRLLNWRPGFVFLLLAQLAFTQEDPTVLRYRTEVRDVTEVVHFQPGSTIPSPGSEAVLREVTEVLAQYPNWKLRIEGYGDHIENDNNDVAIARLRAEAVAQALVHRYRLSRERLV